MSIESELQAQLDFLRRIDTVWVRHAPHRPGEACMVHRVYSGRLDRLSRASQLWLGDWMNRAFGSAPAAPEWNDHHASGRAEVVERLEKAVAAAGEQGV